MAYKWGLLTYKSWDDPPSGPLICPCPLRVFGTKRFVHHRRTPKANFSSGKKNNFLQGEWSDFARLQPETLNVHVDGRNPAPVEVGSLSHYLQGFFTSQVVVWDSFHQQDGWCIWLQNWCSFMGT